MHAVRPVLSMVIEPREAGDFKFAGSITARTRADLGFRVPGRLVARSVSVGDSVVAGQVVAEIDATNLELALQASRAKLAAAQAQLDNAEGIAQRQSALHESGNIPQSSLEIAQLRLRLAQASLSRAESELRKANDQLGYAQLRAEFDGVVTAVLAEPGSDLPAGRPVVSIASPQLRDAEIDMPDAMARALDPGAGFQVALQLDPSIAAHGSVREIAPEADPVTRTRRVKIGLVDPPDAFRIGTIVSATGQAGPASPLEIPSSAIHEADGRTFVWLIDAATHVVALQEVVLGAETGDSVTVVEGLSAGMRIAIAGAHSLVEGQETVIEGAGR